MNKSKRVEENRQAGRVDARNESVQCARQRWQSRFSSSRGQGEEALKELTTPSTAARTLPKCIRPVDTCNMNSNCTTKRCSYSRLCLALDNGIRRQIQPRCVSEKLGRWEHAAQQQKLPMPSKLLEAWLGLGICRLHREGEAGARRFKSSDPRWRSETARFGKAVALVFMALRRISGLYRVSSRRTRTRLVAGESDHHRNGAKTRR